jgi:hypothetical protein
MFSHGSGYSYAICKEFGADPDEVVGGLKDELAAIIDGALSDFEDIAVLLEGKPGAAGTASMMAFNAARQIQKALENE